MLKQQTGLQDIVWAVHGGFGKILFNKKKIIYKKLKISKKNLKKLQDNIILINTYIPRYSDAIEKSKIAVIKQNIQHYHQLKEYVDIASKILSGSNLDNFGELLGEYWNIKKTLSSNVSNYKINDIYSEAVKCGAEGGKILGAGGGGMMLIYCPKKSQKKIFERFKKHKPTKIQFCETGSETITKL